MNTTLSIDQGTESFTSHYGAEGKRLLFLVQRDGIDAAIDFARRTKNAYRRAVISKDVPKNRRRTYIESYLSFKFFSKGK